MNKYSLYTIALAIASMIFLSSCGGGDECVQADWVGTYDLEEGHTCPDPETNLDPLITLEAGDDAGSIVYQDESISITDCVGTGPAGIRLELEGDIIKVDGLGCTGEYIKR